MFPMLLITLLVACDAKKGAEETDTDTTSVEESTAENNESDQKEPVASPRKQAEGTLGEVQVIVDYGSPAVKNREIWGGLEEYGVVWRAGANETTSVAFNEDVVIGGEVVKAGKYGLYMIPKENEDWVVILNTDWDREKHGAWGAYNYTPENDVVRIEVTPEWAEENQERLEYVVVDDGIDFAWEKARITIPVTPAEAETGSETESAE
ncbi:MAG: DUF2911 domain-containing protein [Fulvivirga sp.]|nr:DUF2911 domain-containing protein [Fulvivirga sp.]